MLIAFLLSSMLNIDILMLVEHAYFTTLKHLYQERDEQRNWLHFFGDIEASSYLVAHNFKVGEKCQYSHEQGWIRLTCPGRSQHHQEARMYLKSKRKPHCSLEISSINASSSKRLFYGRLCLRGLWMKPIKKRAQIKRLLLLFYQREDRYGGVFLKKMSASRF